MLTKLIKIIATLVIAVPLLSVVGLEGFYLFKLNQIKPLKVISGKKQTSFVHDTLWVSIGEISNIEVVSTSATRYALGFVSLALSDNHSNLRRVLPKGSRLTSLIAREIVHKKNMRGSWHLNNAVVAIWASNEFSASESLDYILNTSVYGYGYDKFEDAAKFYFDKSDDSLSFSEVLTLIALTKSPSALSPYCRPDRLLVRGNALAKNLAKYNPEKYGDSRFEMPTFVSHSEIICN